MKRCGFMLGAIGLMSGPRLAGANPVLARGETPLILINAELGTLVVERFSVEGEELLVWTRRATTSGTPKEGTPQQQRVPLRECIGVLRDTVAAETGSAVMVFADGQRFPGELRLRSDGANTTGLGWRHRWLGELSADIESLRALLLQPGSVAPSASAADVVVLANGDRLDGLITELGSTVKLERSGSPTAASPEGSGSGQSDAAATEVPIGRVAAIGFITPDSVPNGHRVWCSDGTIVAATPTVDSETGLVLIARPSPTAPVGGSDDSATPRRTPPTPMLRSDELLGFAPHPERVKALAEIDAAEVGTSGETPRSYVERPRSATGIWPLGAAPIVLHGPTRVRFPMPARGCSIVAEFRVVDGDRRWTDFDIVVRDGEKEVLRQHMDAQSGPVALRATIVSDELSIELTEGEQGPIRDSVELRRALVILPAS